MKKCETNAESKSSSDILKGWIRLLLSVIMILVFMFIIAPLMDKAPFVKPLVKFIDEQDIDATALYYTEIEEFSKAEINMRNTMDYQPGKP